MIENMNESQPVIIERRKGYGSGFFWGTLFGGAVGAVTALLLAPKSGKELRQDIANKSTEMYDNATNYISELETEVTEAVSNTYNEGRAKAQSIIESARHQAETLLHSAENVLKEAKVKAYTTKHNVQEKIDTIREAAKASADTFRREMNAPKGTTIVPTNALEADDYGYDTGGFENTEGFDSQSQNDTTRI